MKGFIIPLQITNSSYYEKMWASMTQKEEVNRLLDKW